MLLHDLNPHWELGYRYPFAKHRRLYGELLKKLGLRQILQITGLRRTGKTTLLFQLINQKIYYGLCPNAKFLISGSSSLFIRKRVQESLAGRIFQFVLHPLAFPECLVFTDEAEDGEVTSVEVKYKHRLLQKDLRNLRAFCRKLGPNADACT